MSGAWKAREWPVHVGSDPGRIYMCPTKPCDHPPHHTPVVERHPESREMRLHEKLGAGVWTECWDGPDCKKVHTIALIIGKGI